MNRPMTNAEIDSLKKFTVMTRREKLLRWAELIRQKPRNACMFIYNNLEYMSDLQRQRLDFMSAPESAFTVAIAHPVFQEAGLAGTTLGDIEKFFELSKDELHEFSCDCGGQITNIEMARRIEGLALRSK